MSSIIENVVVEVVVEKKPKAKSFAQKDKKTLFSIMGFLLNLKEQGILDDEKVTECLEALPLYKTAAEKTAFFLEDMFDTNRVEEELYKPMVLEHKKNKKTKKEKKQVSEKKPRVKKVPVEGEVVKEKKPRAKKAKVVVEETSVLVVEETSVLVVEETSVPVVEETSVLVVEEASVPVVEVKEKKPRAKKEKVEGGEPKRGRKPKEQIVELSQDKPNATEEEDETLDALIDSMSKKVECLSLNDPSSLEDICVEDVDDMMRELEAEELVEQPQLPVVVQKKEKKVKTPVLKTGEEKPKKTKKAVVIVENPVV